MAERSKNTGKVKAGETVDVRRVLRSGTVTHDLMDRSTAETIIHGQIESELTQSLRIQPLDKYLEEVNNGS